LEPPPAEPGSRASILQRVGDPAAWSEPDKCRFVATVFLVATFWFSAISIYTLRHPAFEPYVDPFWLPVVLRLQALSLFAWLVVWLCSFALRQRRGPTPVLVGATTATLTWQLAYSAYFVGPLTNPFAGVTVIAVWAAGLILFRAKPVVAGLTVWWLAVIGSIVAEQAGLVPYAPLYNGAPVDGGHLRSSWLVGPGALSVFMILFVQFVLYVIIRRWQDREQTLAATSRQLAQANDVISRYIASQLAEQIRAGNHSALERHERRRLTLFFSDIQDFAATADLIEPEDLSRQLNEYLGAMTSVAETYGATIDKFVGDAIMIFFGAPSATSDRDQALRAVRMAIEMQTHLEALRSRWLSEGAATGFRIRIGINTGQASVGAFGSPSRVEYTAIGRQVNLAARLQAQCEPDRVLLSHSTYTLVRDEIPCTPKGEIKVKGFHQPVQIYEVDRSERTTDH